MKEYVFDRLAEGRLKRLSGLNLKAELDSMDNISMATGRDGDEVLGGKERINGIINQVITVQEA